MKQLDFSKYIKPVDFNSDKVKKEILKVKREIKEINDAAKIDWSKMNIRFNAQ